jgi:hypothetical protein
VGPEHRKGEFFLFFSLFFAVCNEQDMREWVHCIEQAKFLNVLSYSPWSFFIVSVRGH